MMNGISIFSVIPIILAEQLRETIPHGVRKSNKLRYRIKDEAKNVVYTSIIIENNYNW